MIAPTFNRETFCAREHSLKNITPLVTLYPHVGLTGTFICPDLRIAVGMGGDI
jgi:hypothetical protein